MKYYFYLNKNKYYFSECLDFLVFVKYTDYKMLHNESFGFFFSSDKMRFDQIFVYLMAIISNMFLVQLQRLETFTEPFQDFNKFAVQRDLLCS